MDLPKFFKGLTDWFNENILELSKTLLEFVINFPKILHEFLIHSLVSLIETFRHIFEFFIGWLPDLPQLPNEFSQNLNAFIDTPFKSHAVDFIGWIFGGWGSISFVFWASMSVFLFRIGYDTVMFIITKLPVGIKR